VGDMCYTYPGTLISAGRNFVPWNFSGSVSVEEVNETCSAVISFLPCKITPPPYDKDGFDFDFVTRFVEKLKIPFIAASESVFGTSFEYERGLHRRLRPEVVRYLRTVADHSQVVGTRGAYSAEVLRSLGIHNVEPIGCPSLYINGPALNPALACARPFDSIRRIAVCYSNYQKRTDSRIQDVLACAVANGYHYVEQSFNLLVKALYYPGSIEGTDLIEAQEIFHGLNELQALFCEDRVRYFTNYRLWREFLGAMDFAFGARMHGLTPAVQGGVRAMFIAIDSRVREICEFFELPFIAEQDLPRNIDTKALYDQADYGAAMAGYPRRYRAFLDFFVRNGVRPNCDESGRIHDFWEPEPLSDVQLGETQGIGPDDIRHFEQICELGKRMHEGVPSEAEMRIRELSQNWRATRTGLRTPSSS